MPESWTDGRLDDLSKRLDERFNQVDRRFDRVDDRFESLQKEMNLRFAAAQREAIKRQDQILGEMNLRFDSLNHSLLYAVVAVTGTFIAALIAVLVAQL